MGMGNSMGQGFSIGGSDPGRKGFDALTAKQREVLDLLIQHKTSKEISRSLGISRKTLWSKLISGKPAPGDAEEDESGHES